MNAQRQSVMTRFKRNILDGFDRSLLFSRTTINDVLSKLVGSDSIALIIPHAFILIANAVVFM